MMYLPLTRYLPLRDTTAWGRFAAIRPLPRVYGRATLTPVPYDDSGRVFVVADHPIAGIVAVKRGQEDLTSWRLRHGPDTTGRTVAFLDLQAAVLEDQDSLSVTLDGLMDPVTGNLLTNPADVAADLLQWASGEAMDRTRFALWQAQCRRAGLEVAGVCADGTQTIRACLDVITGSAGSLWSGAMPGFGRLLPGLPGNESSYGISSRAIRSVRAQSGLDDIATVVTVNFGYDWSAGEYTGSVTYQAPEEIRRYGRVERTLEAPWLPAARQAAMLAAAHCGRYAVPRWTVEITGDRSLSHVNVGERITCAHRLLPGGAVASALVTGIDRDHAAGSMTLTADYPAAPCAGVEIAGWSGRFTPRAPAGTQVIIGKGSVTIIIADDSGTPLPGAIAAMDGVKTAIADASGRVTFSGVSAGRHSVEIRAAGYAAYTIEVIA